MEARKITIVATNVQKKYVLNSTAETLGELKAELSEANISYEDMTFMEGLTRTEMKDDNSLLPTNVKRVNRETGAETYTNELVFMLTNTSKKIKSGAVDREDLYAKIKNGNLQEACKEKYGKAYTQCSNNDLIILIEAAQKKSRKAAKKATPVASSSECIDENARKAITVLVHELYESDLLTNRIYNGIIAVINGCGTTVESLTSPYSDEEIDEMFRGV